MAAPVDSARVATNSLTGTPYTINVGSPVAGTLLLVLVRFAGAVGTITFTGYTALNGAGGDASDASDDVTIIFYRWADGTEGASDSLNGHGCDQGLCPCLGDHRSAERGSGDLDGRSRDDDS